MAINPNVKQNKNYVKTNDYSKVAKPVLKSNANTSEFLRKEFESGRQYAKSVTEEIELSVSTNNSKNKAGDTNATKVLGKYHNNGQIYYTAEDAKNGTNGIPQNFDSIKGKYTYEAFYNGQFYTIKEGESIKSILAKIGTEKIDDIAIRVMDENGNDLTWETLKNLIKEDTNKNPNNGPDSSTQNGIDEKYKTTQKVLEKAEKHTESKQKNTSSQDLTKPENQRGSFNKSIWKKSVERLKGLTYEYDYSSSCPEVVREQLLYEGLLKPSNAGSDGNTLATYIANGTVPAADDVNISHLDLTTSANKAEDFIKFVNENGRENIVVSFITGYGGISYGHTFLINKIEDGRVYFNTNDGEFSYTVNADGTPAELAIPPEVTTRTGLHSFAVDIDLFLQSGYFTNLPMTDITILTKK